MAFEDARGKSGTVVVRRQRIGLVGIPRTMPENPKTTAQRAVRSYLDRATKAFKNATNAQVAAWNAYGEGIVRHHPVTGKSYTSTGIAAFTELAAKFLQVNPNGTIPMMPPTAAFAGDPITLTANSGLPGQLSFTASAANSANVKTELLVQPLKSKNRAVGAQGWKSKGFVAFATGSLSTTVAVPSGYYAAGYRFVNTQTGQATDVQAISVVPVTLALDGRVVDADTGEVLALEPAHVNGSV